MTDDPNPSSPQNPFHHELPNGRHVALGRPRVKSDRRNLQLSRYLIKPNLPSPPDRVHNSSLVQDWGMYDNDRFGDCTAAGICHGAMLDAAALGLQVRPTQQDCLGLYSAVTGLEGQAFEIRPDGTTVGDNGCVELDVLNYVRKNPVAGFQIGAFVQVDVHDADLMRIALSMFKFVYMGVALPLTAQDQVGKVWDYVDGPGNEPWSWGGHCTDRTDVDYAATQHLWGDVTWGTMQLMTDAFTAHYCDEGYVMIPTNWRDRAPDPAFNYDLLEQDLAAFARVTPA